MANLAPVGNSSKPLSGVGTSSLKGAPSVWSYASADAINTITASGYFNLAKGLLKVGDLIYVLAGAGSGGTPAPRLVYVNANNGTTVDVADGTAISVTDTY